MNISDFKQLEFLRDDNIQQLIEKKRHFCIKKNEGQLIGFYIIDIEKLSLDKMQVYIYCDNQEMITCIEDNRKLEFMNNINKNEHPYAQLLSLFNEIILNDIDVLDDFEIRITLLEDSLLQNKKRTKHTVQKIVNLRRKLLTIKHYYEQLEMGVDSFIENLDEELSDELNHKYNLFSRRLDQYLNSIQSLREMLSQTRDVYQSQIDMEQNNLMKIFTVITTIFTPLTLITGWYGMNFIKMPELSWEYGYVYVICLSIAISCFSIILFKIKGWFK